LKNVFDEGKYCEDDLSKEYFAGVLASSRTKDGKDDRGMTNAKLVSNLSSYQIRTHYIFYTLLRRAFLPHDAFVRPVRYLRGTDDDTFLAFTAQNFQTVSYDDRFSRSSPSVQVQRLVYEHGGVDFDPREKFP